jgi:hypothetical protein
MACPTFGQGARSLGRRFLSPRVWRRIVAWGAPSGGKSALFAIEVAFHPWTMALTPSDLASSPFQYRANERAFGAAIVVIDSQTQ